MPMPLVPICVLAFSVLKPARLNFSIDFFGVFLCVQRQQLLANQVIDVPPMTENNLTYHFSLLYKTEPPCANPLGNHCVIV